MGVIILSSQGVARDAERTSGKHCTPCRPAESSPRSAEQLLLGLLWLSSGCQQRQHFRLADVIVLLHGAGPHPRQMLRALWHDPAAQAEVAPSATSIMPITVAWRARGSLWMPLTGDSPLLRQQAGWPRSELKPFLGVISSRGTITLIQHTFPGQRGWAQFCVAYQL